MEVDQSKLYDEGHGVRLTIDESKEPHGLDLDIELELKLELDHQLE